MLELIEQSLGKRRPPWTKTAHLPGGDFAVDGFDQLLARVRSKYPFLGDSRSMRMAHAYGSDIWQLLGDAATAADLGPDFGCGLTGREVDYLIAKEWARSADDILWRRSKLGISMTPEQAVHLDGWIRSRRTVRRPNVSPVASSR